LNIARPAAQDHYLKARIVIEMGMERRNDNFVMFMLKVGEFFREKASVMVIDQRHGSHNRSRWGYDRSPHKPVPYQVAESLGPIVVAFFSDEFVKPIE
jgi:hypothetical protein